MKEAAYFNDLIYTKLAILTIKFKEFGMQNVLRISRNR